jgi:DNA primase
MTQRYIRLDAAIARARETDVLGVAERLGARLKKAGGEWVGPCPRCGGLDRFAINARKRIFNCRRCGIGGDAIGMVEHFTGSSFVEAVQFIGAARRGSKGSSNGSSQSR